MIVRRVDEDAVAVEIPGFAVQRDRELPYLGGEFLQKLVNYRFQIAVLGDVSAAAAAASEPLRDFIRESNRGQTVWFVDDLAGLEAKLSAA